MNKDQIIYEDIEPNVIDGQLLKIVLDQYVPPGEAARLQKLEGIPLEDVQNVRIEFHNILVIDHLWIYPNLTKLSLSNNRIRKIDNLNELVNLKELNLSFNEIERIDGVDQLHQLEIFTLYSNQIQVLENMDNLMNLKILSIGRNRITNLTNLFYLRNFQKLTTLNASENPCTNQLENCRQYIIAILPNLKYYQYRLILIDERELAQQVHFALIKRIEESERDVKELKRKLIDKENEEQFNIDSFVEHLGDETLFECMFNEDKNGKLLLKIGQEIEDVYEDFKLKFLQVTNRLFKIGREMYEERKREYDEFVSITDEGKLESQKNSQDLLQNKFLFEKQQIFDKAKNLIRDDNNYFKNQSIDDDIVEQKFKFNEESKILIDNFNKLIETTWMALMDLENTLHEQLQETNGLFSINITDMINKFIEQAQTHFIECRQLEIDYQDSLTEIGSNYTKELIADVLSNELKEILNDRDNLANAVIESHEVHMEIIDSREDKLINRAKQWLKSVTDNLDMNEVERNRNRVLEINCYLEIQRDEFDLLQLQEQEGGTNYEDELNDENDFF